MSSQLVFLGDKKGEYRVNSLQELSDLVDDCSSIRLYRIGSSAGGSVIFKNNGKWSAINYLGYKALESEYLQSNQPYDKADALRNQIEACRNKINPAQQV